nr:hypothetical protein [Streptomyces hygroscopicus]
MFASTSVFNIQLKDWLRPANRDTCGYSVHPFSVGRRIKVKAGLDEVLVFREGTEVARHLRCWARHLTITDPAHSVANLGGEPTTGPSASSRAAGQGGDRMTTTTAASSGRDVTSELAT